jgi:hypothetical protein
MWYLILAFLALQLPAGALVGKFLGNSSTD